MINGSAPGQQTNLLISNRRLSANVVADIAEHPVEPGWHISNLIYNNIVRYGVSVSCEGEGFNRHGAMMMLIVLMMMRMMVGLAVMLVMMNAYVINLQSEHGKMEEVT